jgi:hypothetical protein
MLAKAYLKKEGNLGSVVKGIAWLDTGTFDSMQASRICGVVRRTWK